MTGVISAVLPHRLGPIAPPDADEHPETGKRLRDYRLVRKIGEGGMGTVYHAVHVHLAKHVALKILPADKLSSRQSVSRFRQEMRAVGKVNHPNVVSASDAGTVDGQHFLVMELVQGADLARIIHDRGPLNVPDACEIVRQAAIGLQHAHDNGLVHRDVKPSNIMLALDGPCDEQQSDADIVRYKDHFYIAFVKPIQERENAVRILPC